MSESAKISASNASAQCPACGKPLLTQSSRLCLFCGEKLPEHLLLPLAEVHREEQQSLDAVKRVLAAYGAREQEIINRARHITHILTIESIRFVTEEPYPFVQQARWNPRSVLDRLFWRVAPTLNRAVGVRNPCYDILMIADLGRIHISKDANGEFLVTDESY